jgi:DNA primase
MPGIDYSRVRGQVSLERVLQLIGFLPVKTDGQHVRGPCPIHGSTNPNSRSFSADLRKNAWQCFQCGAKGNQLDLWAAVNHGNLYQAAISLCEQAHVQIPWVHRW